MSRVKGGTVTHARHKKIIDQAKGYYGRRKNTFKVAAQAVDKANQYATRDRHNQAQFPRFVDQRINAAVRSHDEALTYSRFINGLNLAGIEATAKFWLIWLFTNQRLLVPSCLRQSGTVLSIRFTKCLKVAFCERGFLF